MEAHVTTTLPTLVAYTKQTHALGVWVRCEQTCSKAPKIDWMNIKLVRNAFRVSRWSRICSLLPHLTYDCRPRKRDEHMCALAHTVHKIQPKTEQCMAGIVGSRRSIYLSLIVRFHDAFVYSIQTLCYARAMVCVTTGRTTMLLAVSEPK